MELNALHSMKAKNDVLLKELIYSPDSSYADIQNVCRELDQLDVEIARKEKVDRLVTFVKNLFTI